MYTNSNRQEGNTMTTLTELQQAAEAVARANIAKAAAEEAEKAAKAAFKRLAAEAGETAVVVPEDDLAGAKVAIVVQDRETYDVAVLKTLVEAGAVSKGTFYKVTERTVVRAAWAEAIRTDRVAEAVADKVTTVTPVEVVRVTVPAQA
jgi:hypothetical protein